jgi:comEA protein
LQNLNQSQKAGIAAVLVIIAAVVGWSALHTGHAVENSSLQDPPSQTKPTMVVPGSAPTPGIAGPAATSSSPDIVVHIAGAVSHPGVYHLPAGARGIDGINAAGGALADANTNAVNLAAKLEDGAQLYLPTQTEQPGGGATALASASKSRGGRRRRTQDTEGAASDTPSSRSARSSDKLSDPSQGQIDINTASAEDLQRLPGVGPAMATRIIAFREQNQGFKSVEDLRSVQGIGDKKLARMAPFVIVK